MLPEIKEQGHDQPLVSGAHVLVSDRETLSCKRKEENTLQKKNLPH